ncbi:prephenate dehydrogenase (NADP(+)) [Coelomomyces lativittatus]|nr:prephenate dehydrogenase (NADP(+)) [Coelomomyces lativittatus]
MGAMGQFCARQFYESGWTSINVCDVPENYQRLKGRFPQYNVCHDGHIVHQISDYILYCVNSASVSQLIQNYAPSMKPGTTVGGQTSTKSLEIKAFEAFCPRDVNIVTCHSFHGPDVESTKYPLVVIRQRSSDDAFENACKLFKSLHPTPIFMSLRKHELLTAHVQILLHTCLLARTWSQMQSIKNPFSSDTDLFILPLFRMLKQPWYIYGEMAMSHPFAALVFSKLIDFLSSDNSTSADFSVQRTFSISSNILVPTFLPECIYGIVRIAPHSVAKCQTPLYRYIDTLVRRYIGSKNLKKGVTIEPNFLNSFELWVNIILTKNTQKYKSMFEEMKILAKPYMDTAEYAWKKNMKFIEAHQESIKNEE